MATVERDSRGAIVHGSDPWEPHPESSWAVARSTPGRWAASDAAQATAEALAALMAASCKRSMTVQWMPDEPGQGGRFEIIGVHTGNYLAIVTIDDEGRVTMNGEEAPRAA